MQGSIGGLETLSQLFTATPPTAPLTDAGDGRLDPLESQDRDLHAGRPRGGTRTVLELCNEIAMQGFYPAANE